MKLKKYIYGVTLGMFSLTFASCYNSESEFPDYEGGTTAYFAYQFPVRTLILGNDIYNNTLDNAHKCQIWATMGGAYKGRDAVADVVVDETLCDNLWFVDAGGNPSEPVLPLPKEYYELAGNTIPYNGDQRGYIEVQFTDAFFNDPKAIENTYVIPLLMTNVKGIDHILTGKPREGLTPARQNTSGWDVLAKDYVLYCVKYKNPWDAKYIRRGVDNVTENGVTNTVVRKDFSLVNSDQEHYKGLTYDYMRAYIAETVGKDNAADEEREAAVKEALDVLESKILISKCHSNTQRYPAIRKWFLATYPEVKEVFKSDAA